MTDIMLADRCIVVWLRRSRPQKHFSSCYRKRTRECINKSITRSIVIVRSRIGNKYYCEGEERNSFE